MTFKSNPYLEVMSMPKLYRKNRLSSPHRLVKFDDLLVLLCTTGYWPAFNLPPLDCAGTPGFHAPPRSQLQAWAHAQIATVLLGRAVCLALLPTNIFTCTQYEDWEENQDTRGQGPLKAHTVNAIVLLNPSEVSIKGTGTCKTEVFISFSNPGLKGWWKQ